MLYRAAVRYSRKIFCHPAALLQRVATASSFTATDHARRQCIAACVRDMSDPAQTVTVGAMSYQVSDSMGDSIIKRYSQMYSFWHVNRRQSVDIFVQGHAKPFRVPMDWLHRSGFLIWSFVVEVLGLFVNESGSLFRPDTAAGTPILPTEDVTAGQYVFKPDSGMSRLALYYLCLTYRSLGEFTWRNGPYGPKIHGVAPSPEDMDLATSESISVASSVRVSAMASIITGQLSCS